MKKVKKCSIYIEHLLFSYYIYHTCVFIFVFWLLGRNLSESILPIFEYDYVSSDCFLISLESFVRQPEVDVLHSWPVILPQFSGKSSLKEWRHLAIQI